MTSATRRSFLQLTAAVLAAPSALATAIMKSPKEHGYVVTRRNRNGRLSGWFDETAGVPYVRSICGSFVVNGLHGTMNDFVVAALIRCQDGTKQRAKLIACGADTYRYVKAAFERMAIFGDSSRTWNGLALPWNFALHGVPIRLMQDVPSDSMHFYSSDWGYGARPEHAKLLADLRHWSA